MRITKRQLRRIIKEEKRKALNEGSVQASEEKAHDAIWELLDAYFDKRREGGWTNRQDAIESAIVDLRNFVDGFIEESVRRERDALDRGDVSRLGPPEY